MSDTRIDIPNQRDRHDIFSISHYAPGKVWLDVRLVHGGGYTVLTVAQAREIAAALQRAADDAERIAR